MEQISYSKSMLASKDTNSLLFETIPNGQSSVINSRYDYWKTLTVNDTVQNFGENHHFGFGRCFSRYSPGVCRNMVRIGSRRVVLLTWIVE